MLHSAVVLCIATLYIEHYNFVLHIPNSYNEFHYDITDSQRCPYFNILM